MFKSSNIHHIISNIASVTLLPTVIFPSNCSFFMGVKTHTKKNENENEKFLGQILEF